MTEETKKPRRKRRSKAEIEAEKAAKAAAVAEVKEMEAAGFEHVRARDEHGHFIADDPSTPENEAWNWVKTEDNGRFSDPSSFAEEEEEECIPCQESAMKALEAAEAAVEEEEPEKDSSPDYVTLTGRAKLRSRLSQREKKLYHPKK